MKVNFKRVATAALAVAMSLSLSVPAFAAGNGGNKTLTVTGDTLDKKKVYAVQMFDARLTEGGSSNTFDNYELVNAEKWLGFFTAGTAAGGMGLTDQDKDSDTDADDARAYLEKMTTESTEVKAFADKAQAWVRNHSADFTVIASDTESEPVADQETFTGLKPGYYLVYPEGGSTGNDSRGTDAMLVNVPRDNDAVLNIKSTFPTVEKTVEDNNENTTGDGANGSAQVGDIVTFTLKSKVPDMTDYTTFYFAFNDTLSNGLKFVEKTPGDSEVDAKDVTVTIGGKTVTSGYSASQNGRDLEIVFTDLKNGVIVTDGTVTPGAEIVVTYQAMITEAAVVGTPALNTVKVVYSNDPTTNTKGESTPDESKVYTYDIDVNKWALSGKEDEPGTDEDESKIENLADAQFQLTTDEAGKEVVKLVPNGTDAYRVAKPDATQPNGYETGAVDSFLTTDSGDITIAGLEAGTYYLHEVKAPDGYNKLKKPVKIEIVVAGEDYEHATIEVDDEAATGAEGNVIDVENKKGIELPETGSIGTIGLTALGVVVVVAGLFAFPRKKKTRQD